MTVIKKYNQNERSKCTLHLPIDWIIKRKRVLTSTTHILKVKSQVIVGIHLWMNYSTFFTYKWSISLKVFTSRYYNHVQIFSCFILYSKSKNKDVKIAFMVEYLSKVWRNLLCSIAALYNINLLLVVRVLLNTVFSLHFPQFATVVNRDFSIPSMCTYVI